MEENNETKGNKWILPVLVLLAVGGGFFFVNRQMANKVEVSQTPGVTSTQKTDTETSESITTTNSLITVEGGMFFFKPNEIVVKKGETVEITFNNNEGMHDFVIDDFNVKTKVIGAGKSETVEFVVDKAGEFQFYCSVGNHQQMGMVGKLIVEE